MSLPWGFVLLTFTFIILPAFVGSGRVIFVIFISRIGFEGCDLRLRLVLV